MEYILHLLILIAIYAVLAASLDLLAGCLGLLSVAHAAFYGVGAYAAALLATRSSAGFVVAVAIAMAVAALASLPISLAALRLHEDYLVVATFGFQMIVFSILNNWIDLTRGPLGIPGIPQPAVFGLVIQSRVGFLILAWAFVALTHFVVGRVTTSPFGRVLLAVREDEVIAKALGKSTLRSKVCVFSMSAALAGLAGALYAYYLSYIDPVGFTVVESILIISMVIVGGAGSRWGPLIGASVLVTLPEALRLVGLPGSVAANLRQVFYGCLLVLMMLLRPRGLVGRYGFGR